MDARELAEWQAFEHVFGPITVQERVDAAGAIAAWGAVKAAGSNAQPTDFMPDWSASGEGRKEQSPDEMIAVMRGLQGRRKGKREHDRP